MPSTIVKLSSGHARAWAHNQPVWLTESGDIARPVTRSEQHAISRALERTAKVGKSFRLDLTLEDVVATPNGMVRRRAPLGRSSAAVAPPQRITCAFEVQTIATKRVVTVWFDSLRYATGREVIAAEILAEHGECVLHGRNGKCIAVLRDPLVAEREPNYGRRVQYSSTHVERNDAEAQLAIELEEPDASVIVSPMQQASRRGRFSRPGQGIHSIRPASKGGKPAPRTAAPRTVINPPRRAPVPRITATSPSNCPNDCRGKRGGQAWSLAKGAVPPTPNQHHPVCKYAREWDATLTPPETSSVLYDLELGRMARTAMPEEVAEADLAERTTTMRNITVAGRLYAVLPRDEADLAAREARGETVELPPIKERPVLRPIEPEAEQEAEAESEEPTERELPHRVIANDEDMQRFIAETTEGSYEQDVEHDMPTEPAPPLHLGLGPSVLIEEVSEPEMSSSSESERDSWPELSEVAGPEGYRRRAEVTARSYLSRTPSAPPPLEDHT